MASLVSRDKNEQANSANESFYEALVRQSSDCICTIDLDGNFTYMSPRCLELFGLSKAEAIGLHSLELIKPEHKQLVETADTRARNGETVSLQYQVTAAQGRRWLESVLSPIKHESGEIFGLMCVSKDITDKKEIEGKTRESEEKFRVSFDEAPIGKALLALDGSFLDVNKAWVTMLGYTKQELLTKKMGEITHPDDLAASMNIFREYVSQAIPSIDMEKRYVRQDGEVMWGHTRANLVLDSEDKPLYSIAQTEDVTALIRSKELSDSLNDINNSIHSTLDFDEIMQRVIVNAAEGIGVESAAIYLAEGDYWRVDHILNLPEELRGQRIDVASISFMGQAIRTMEPARVGDLDEGESAESEFISKYRIRSGLAVPLIIRERVVGIISFFSKSKPKTLSDDEVDFAEKVASTVSLAIENANLYEIERHIAETLQDAILTMPERLKSVSFSHLYRSATEAAKVGGDFYDLFALESGKIGIIAGDVSGKGVESTNIAAMAKNLIKAYAHDEHPPAVVMQKTNQVMSTTVRPEIFATAFFGVLDVNTGSLKFCNAGHPPPMINRHAGRVDLLEPGSPALGMGKNLTFHDQTDKLSQGERLVLYSDGITESRGGREFFGESRLVQLVSDSSQGPVQDMADRIFETVADFSKGRQSDDLILLVVSIEGENVRSNT